MTAREQQYYITWQWVAGIMVTLLLSVMGYFVSETSASQRRVSDTVSELDMRVTKMENSTFDSTKGIELSQLITQLGTQVVQLTAITQKLSDRVHELDKRISIAEYRAAEKESK